MADNVTITPGSGNVVAADEVTDGTLGQVKVQYVKLMDGTLDSTNKAIITSGGALKVDVDNFPASQAVTGTFFQATQPVSGSGSFTVAQATGTNLHTVLDSGTLTSITNALPAGTNLLGHIIADSGSTTVVTGNVTVIQPTGTNLHTVVDSGSVTLTGSPAVSGTVTANQGTANSSSNKWPVALVDSGGVNVASVNATNELLTTDTDLTLSQASTTAGQFGPLIQGAVTTSAPVYVNAQTNPLSLTTAGALRTDASATTQPISGTVTATQGTSPWLDNVSQFGGNAVVTGVGASGVGIPRVTVASDSQMQLMPASLCISVTAATGVAVTATLPAVAGQFHYIDSIVITKYFTAANAASATPLIVTTTNLPGSLAFSFGQPLGTIGTTDVRVDNFGFPLKSSVVNTNTTIVAPATTGIIWRINVFYYAAA